VTQPSLPSSKTLADWLKDIGAIFLERKDIISSEHQTDLLNGDLFPIRQGHHLDDQKKICFIVIELWPLIGIGDVFQQQRVENKLLADRLEYLDVVDPLTLIQTTDSSAGGASWLA
jgi:hypothetical protein